MARITASPNPVGFYTGSGEQDISVEWDTEGGFNGIVYVGENALLSVPKDRLIGQRASGARSGKLPLKVTYPNVYYLSLRRADNDQEIAHTVVTTFNLREQLAEDFSKAYLPQLRPQMITHLVVKPGVDTVRISFRTARPTIPKIELRDNAGAWVDGRMPLLGGLRTSHAAGFGIDRPLALNTKHTFTIEVFGVTGNKQSPNKTIVTGEFLTGTRSVDVMFETIKVLDDGDPGARGEGEFSFSFGVGDAATRAMIGDPGFWPDTGRAGISDDDPPVDVGKTLSMAPAPRRIWLQVIGSESDSTILPWEAGIGFGRRPAFEEPGSDYRGSGPAQQTTVSAIFDLGSAAGRRMIPFEMKTADLPVEFVVNGHFGVNATAGSTISPKIAKSAGAASSSAFLTEPGSAAGLAVAGAGERTELVALGADRALYHRSTAAALPAEGDGGGWTRIELPGRGAPVVLAADPRRLDVIDLSDDGSVIHCGYDLQKSRSGKWRRLGGRFREIHPAVSRGRGRGGEGNLTLFGVADDGSVHARDAHSGGDGWDRLGDRPARAIAPVSAAGAGPSLLAVGEDGILVRYSGRNGRWKAEPIEGRVPGESPTQLLTAVVIEGLDGKDAKRMRRDLVIGAMSEDHRVRILRWPGYPAGAPERRWEELGPVQELLTQGGKEAAAKTRGAPRRAASKRRATSNV